MRQSWWVGSRRAGLEAGLRYPFGQIRALAWAVVPPAVAIER
ncbi:MAG TPA: hypothetical protein V6D46_07720 [Coleofasciculaceae cyanobacterium]